MKKYILAGIIGLLLFSCSEKELPLNPTNSVVGKWQLIKAEFNFTSKGKTIIDFSDKNITYNFKTNGKLIVSGKGNSIHNEGEYDYFFGKDYLGSNADPKILLVKMDNTRWTYTAKKGEMILGRSYIDGPDLTFKKITD